MSHVRSGRVAAGAGERSGGVGSPKPVLRPQGGDSGEWVTQLERSPTPDDGPRPASRSAIREPVELVGGLAAPHASEVLIDEGRRDVHVEEEALKARVLMEEDDSRFLEDLAIFLSDRPQGGNVVGLGA